MLNIFFFFLNGKFSVLKEKQLPAIPAEAEVSRYSSKADHVGPPLMFFPSFLLFAEGSSVDSSCILLPPRGESDKVIW